MNRVLQRLPVHPSRNPNQGGACRENAQHPAENFEKHLIGRRRRNAGHGSRHLQDLKTSGATAGRDRQPFAARAFDRPRSRSLLAIGSPQAAGAGCNSIRAASSHFDLPHETDGQQRTDTTVRCWPSLSSRLGAEREASSVSVSGQASWRVFTRGGFARHAKPNAPSCRAMHVCADQYSGACAKSFGPRKPLKSLRLRLDAASELRLTKSRASESLLQNQ
jgi:hypothetical protein